MRDKSSKVKLFRRDKNLFFKKAKKSGTEKLVPDVIEDFRNEKLRSYFFFIVFSVAGSRPSSVITHLPVPDSHLDS